MDTTADSLKRQISAYSRSLGFGLMRVTSAERFDKEGQFLATWLNDGCAGEMTYMEPQPDRRSNPLTKLPSARSIISLAASYYEEAPSELSDSRHEGRLARYAWGKDYHKTIQKRLDSLLRYIEALAPGHESKIFLDTGPLLERAAAQRAGLGFVGKNTMLITRGLGSWVFIANIITTVELTPDQPDTRTCGSCTLCIDACPTEALTAPYHLDARRCVSYLSIELRNDIPIEMRPKMAEWLFGCDICQDVCPHNTRVAGSLMPELRSEVGAGKNLDLETVLQIKSDDEFNHRWGHTPLKRTGRVGLIRNACVTAANQGRHDLLPLLEQLTAEDSHPIIREHARWAVQHLSSAKREVAIDG